ncbi:MAG: cation transporter [Lachnospiraceae bacterium]|nr:cation transporter [Lachnospiraceae bacterium]
MSVNELTGNEKAREKVIVRTGIVGIVVNLLLAGFKAVIGLISGSIAIVMDAVNNTSDALSSLISIIGAKLAAKEPDRKHPFGYGRIEYLSAMIISLIVLYAGITSFTESVKKIINPNTPDYSTVSLVIVFAAVFVKIFLGRYVKAKGEQVNSDSLVNSGKDALLDAVISTGTVIAALIFIFTGLSLEAWLGAIISVVIIKSGADMIKDTISEILGEPGEVSLITNIKKTIAGFPEVSGAYDLVLHNYGPDTYNGSVHIEVPDTLSAEKLDKLTRDITTEIYNRYNVLLTAVGVYSFNTGDERIIAIKEKVKKLVLAQEYVLQMHGFYLDEEEKYMRFDVVVSFDAPSRNAVYENILHDLKETFPDYEFIVAMDIDFGGLNRG